MSSVSSRTMSQVCADSAAALNDPNQQEYTLAKLLPFLNRAWSQIQDEFVIHGLEFGEKFIQATDVSYTAGDDHITLAGGVTDFEMPIEIYERGSTTEQWMVPGMQRTMRLPPPQVGTQPDTLGFYEFSEGIMKVNPCSANRLILLRYQKVLPYLTSGSTTVGLDGFYFPLSLGTAQKAAEMAGRTEDAAGLKNEYAEALGSAIAKQINNQQKVPAPRVGFSSQFDGTFFKF